MGKENSYVLRGKLVRKPAFGFSYSKTRSGVTLQLLKFKATDKEQMFDDIGNLKVEEDKFDIPLKMNKHVLSGTRNSIEREQKICEVLEQLEKFFGIGIPSDEATEVRIKEMEAQGIIPVSHFTEFEAKDFDS